MAYGFFQFIEFLVKGVREVTTGKRILSLHYFSDYCHFYEPLETNILTKLLLWKVEGGGRIKRNRRWRMDEGRWRTD